MIKHLSKVVLNFKRYHKLSPCFLSIYNKNIYRLSQQNPGNKNNKFQEQSSFDRQMRQKVQQKLKQNNQPLKATSFGTTVLMISAVSLLIAYAIMEIQIVRANKKKPQATSKALAKIIGVGKAQIGGDWQLIDINGNKFGSKQLSGKYYLIYFGFTHCPDICPNSLNKLSRAVAKVKKSSQASFFDLQTVFVSVDPDRDSPQKLKKFMQKFDKNMIGVTGANNQDPILRQCMKKFKIYASKLQYEQGDETNGRKSYTIDHTILTYLISDTNQYLAHLGANLGQNDLSKLIIQKIQQDKRQKLINRKL